MKNANFIAGKLEDCGSFSAFKPNKINHQFELDYNKILSSLQDAAYKLATLNSLYKNNNLSIFDSILCLLESLCSSAIEGTYVTPQNILLDNASSKVSADTKKIQSLWAAIKFFQKTNLNLSSINFFEEINSKVLPSPQEVDIRFGKIRNCQNFVGGFNSVTARFVPPQPQYIKDLLQDLCDFWNNKKLSFPILIKIAIFHYQFETIHPFVDGNGRTGRILINMQLNDANLLNYPALCLSEFWSRNKEHYYEALGSARYSNNIEYWIVFFLQSIITTCEERIKAISEIEKLKMNCEEKIKSQIKNPSKHLDLLNYLLGNLYITTQKTQEELQVSYQVANKIIHSFVKLNILEKSNSNKRNMSFFFKKYGQIIFNNLFTEQD